MGRVGILSHAVSALRWCSVLRERWILPHYAGRASFSIDRWSAKVCMPVRPSVLWPAAWVSYVDKSRSSKSVEVRRIWEAYDEALSYIPPAFWQGIRSSLLVGDVSSAWRIWSFFAEVSLVRAFVVSGGPVSGSSFRLGRGAAGFKTVSIGGPVVRKVRSDLGSGDGQAVHLFKDSSVSRVIVLRRRLGSVLSVLDGISRGGLTLSRDLELSAQWNAIVSAGPCGLLCRANFDVSPAVGLSSFGDHVRVLHDVVVDFLHKVVVFRRDVAVRSWRSWMLEDDRVHPYRWLKPDLVAPAPLLCCDPCLTVDGSGVLSDPGRIDEQSRSSSLIHRPTLMYACMHVCLFVCLYACLFVCLCVCVMARVRMRVRVRVRVRVCVCVCVFVCLCVFVCVMFVFLTRNMVDTTRLTATGRKTS